MTPAERRALLAVVVKALDEALSDEAMESPEAIAAVIVAALLDKYEITPKGRN